MSKPTERHQEPRTAWPAGDLVDLPPCLGVLEKWDNSHKKSALAFLTLLLIHEQPQWAGSPGRPAF